MMPRLLLALLLSAGLAPAASAFTGMGDAERGKTLFNMRCAICHGENGRGRDGMAPDLIGEWHRLTKSDAELAQGIRNGLRTPGKIYGAGPMPPQMLNDRDLEDVLTHMRAAFGGPQFDFKR